MYGAFPPWQWLLLLGLLLGAVLAVYRFPGRRAVKALNALMGLPRVVVGLVLYLFFAPGGPLVPGAVIFTNSHGACPFFLILPIIADFPTFFGLYFEYQEQLCPRRPSQSGIYVVVGWKVNLVTAVMAFRPGHRGVAVLIVAVLPS